MMRKLKLDELNRISVEGFKQADKLPITVILDNIRSLNNIGSIFRTCDALRIEKIYLCGITAKPPHKDIQKTALGATDSVVWEYQKEINRVIEKLRNDNYEIVGIEQVENSCLLNEYQPSGDAKLALIFGHEVKGVQQSVINQCDYCLEIPQFGTKHSFNISVSAGIVLWDIFSKLKKR